MAPSGNAAGSHDFINHEQRISGLEARTAGGEKTADDRWSTVLEIQRSVTQISIGMAGSAATGSATLETTNKILRKMETFDARANEIEVTHAQVKTGLNILMGIAASIGAVISGVVTFVVTHFLSTGAPPPAGHP